MISVIAHKIILKVVITKLVSLISFSNWRPTFKVGVQRLPKQEESTSSTMEMTIPMILIAGLTMACLLGVRPSAQTPAPSNCTTDDVVPMGSDCPPTGMVLTNANR